MKQVFKIDSNGFYIEPVILQDDEKLGNNLIDIAISEGFYRPKWYGKKWVEGLTQLEIDALRNVPQPKTEIELLKEENIQLLSRVQESENAIVMLMDMSLL
jgi:hypothetical protein